jgi:hypothetical protein
MRHNGDFWPAPPEDLGFLTARRSGTCEKITVAGKNPHLHAATGATTRRVSG